MTTPFPSPWPANFQGCRLKGQFLYLNGQPVAGGAITLAPTPVALLDDALAITIVTKTLTVTLGSNGQIKGWDGTGADPWCEIPATDDPDINPTAWTYTVSENWSGGRKGYSIDAPQGQTIDLVRKAPVPASSGVPIYRGPAGIPLGTVQPPASATDEGQPGQMAYDVNYLYVCTAVDTWARAPLAGW